MALSAEIGQLTDVSRGLLVHAWYNELGSERTVRPMTVGIDSTAREVMTLEPCANGARTARRFVIVTLRRWKAVELILEASDAVTELVEGAAARSGDDIDLVLVREHRGVRAEVYDGSQIQPAATVEVNGLRRRAS
jgi:hypothetical protein